MSTFHSTVTRRQFMKGLGLTGAGLGSTALIGPNFHDLDEVIAEPAAIYDKPWYIKELEIEKPTVEIDWTQIVRNMCTGDKKILGVGSPADAWNAKTNPDSAEILQNYNSMLTTTFKRIAPEWKKSTIRDFALQQAATSIRINHVGNDASGFLGPNLVPTPIERGMPKWEGTPEENFRMLRVALRLFGASDVGCTALTENTRKLIWSKDQTGVPFVFEDVDTPYVSKGEKNVIPNKCQKMLVWTVIQPTELARRDGGDAGYAAIANQEKAFGPGHAGAATGYFRMAVASHQIQEFIRGIGYERACGPHRNMAPSNPWGALSGLGEHARESHNLVSPKYGATIRGVDRLLTDLPIPETRPIDAGIARFCITCKICADDCPFGALPTGDPSWDHTYYQSSGYKGWRMNNRRCTFCAVCQGVCPFNGGGSSLAHDIVRVAAGTTTLFNSFFASMERTFEFGFKNPEDWWGLDNEPTYGIRLAFL